MTQHILIIGASGGIGRALVAAHRARADAVTELSRSSNGLDLTEQVSVDAHLGALEGPFDRVIVATGALEIAGAEPEKSIKSVTAQAMAAQFALNTIGPALCLRHAARLLPRKSPSVWATLSARVGSIGDNRLGGWTSYRAAKAAVNQVVRCAAIELARSHKQAAIVSLHPGTVATPFTQKYLSRHPSVPPEEAAGNLLSVMDNLDAAQSGRFFDWQGEEVAW
ncbi:SDR family NAD(P)-dependent oxidoreductase [Primorskyibacter sp. S187A]|uniref:SDR family NAD(P)-dependent oxidoreductase n=1 Tax=Primorskyibacter sp. S187A TaxID=3415130 RepID=UPI003C7D1491